MFLQPFQLLEKVLVGTEKLSGAQIAAMTVIGLLVVFSALLILVLYLYGSGGVFQKQKPFQRKPPELPAGAKAAPKVAPKKTAPAATAKPAPPQAAAQAAEEDDAEVIAVIMAAIAAMGAAEGKQYRLKSVQAAPRVSARSAWAQAGRADMTRPF